MHHAKKDWEIMEEVSTKKTHSAFQNGIFIAKLKTMKSI